MEADAKHKAEQEEKRLEHEEEMFILDLQRAYDAELSAGAAEKKRRKELKEVEVCIDTLEKK